MNRKLLLSLFASAAVLTLCFVTACDNSGPSGTAGGNNTTNSPPPAPIPAGDEGSATTTSEPPKTGG